MKLHTFATTLFSLILLACLSVACDPCTGCSSGCENGGVCADGDCACDAEYAGPCCQYGINERHAGEYTTNDSIGRIASYVVTVETQTDPKELLIKNLGNLGIDIIAMVDTMRPDFFTIPQQDFDFGDYLQIEGHGQLTYETNTDPNLSSTSKSLSINCTLYDVQGAPSQPFSLLLDK